MKFVAAYLLACLGAEAESAAAAAAAATEGAEGAGAAAPAPAAPARPSKDDVRRILGSVGAEVEESLLDLLFAQLEGKDVAELIAAGREQLAYAPSGAAAVAVAAAAPVAAGGAAAEAKEEKKEDDDEGEMDEGMFDLFGED